MRTALIAGATGLVGNQLLQFLVNDDSYHVIKVLVRKPIDNQHPKIQIIETNFDNLNAYESQLVADDFYCCLGTTMKQAKSKEAFKKVDYDYPLALAQIAKHVNASQYLLVSALGANEHSGIYYNKIKGQVERAIMEVGLPTLHIVRPSLLLGDRKEHRSGEDAAKFFYKIFGALIPKKYKGIQATSVACAMLSLAKKNMRGVYIHESVELQQY